MLNVITIMGRLTRDPELRYTQSQTPVASFTVAVDRDFSGKDGAEKQTDFIDCVAWRNTADFISKYFAKGRMIVASGSLQSRKWTDKNGNNRVSWEVIVNNAYFGDSKKDGQQTGYGQPAAYAPPPAAGYQQQSYQQPAYGGGFTELTEDDGDLPF